MFDNVEVYRLTKVESKFKNKATTTFNNDFSVDSKEVETKVIYDILTKSINAYISEMITEIPGGDSNKVVTFTPDLGYYIDKVEWQTQSQRYAQTTPELVNVTEIPNINKVRIPETKNGNTYSYTFTNNDIRKNISIVSQNTVLFDDTILNNICLNNKEVSENQVISICKKCGIYDFIRELPDGLNTVIGERGVKLSGGQKQKLFIVLALIPNPKVVFLDELTTGLDTKARRGVWKSLQELKEQGLTIFLSSHFMDEVEILCDRIGILKDGGFVFEGTVQEAVELSPHERLEDAYLWFTGEEETGDE